jgi:hypothetical protein
LVYDLYLILDIGDQIRYRIIYDQQMKCSELFDDEAKVILNFDKLPIKNLWKASKELGGYLYSTTIGLKCYQRAMVDKFGVNLVLSNMNEHYQKFKDNNGSVCCFCGLEEMAAETLVEPQNGVELPEESQRRASYDHYLPKAHYPFLAVDFNNLIPCCDVCNEDFKDEKDLLISKNVRSIAFKPFANESANLVAKYENRSGYFYKMRVAVENTGCDIEKKTHTWNRIFRSLDRANAILEKNFEEEWMAPLLCNVATVADAKNLLQQFGTRYSLRSKNSREAYFKSICFISLSEIDDQEISPLLSAVSDIYSPRAENL